MTGNSKPGSRKLKYFTDQTIVQAGVKPDSLNYLLKIYMCAHVPVFTL